MELKPVVVAEQTIYARCLDWGTRAALLALTASFFAYVSSLVEPLVPLHELPGLWTLSADRYIAATGAPSGWGWLRLLGKGDYLNFVAIVMLGLMTVACYARILPSLLARGERLQAWLVVAQLLVLLAAASGVFTAGH